MDLRRQEPFESEAAAGAREKSRDSLFLQAVLSIGGFPDPVTVRVRNLSAGGMLAEAKALVAEGTNVLVELTNVGSVPGRIVWASGGKFGVAFDRTIDPQTVRRKQSDGGEGFVSNSGFGRPPIRRR